MTWGISRIIGSNKEIPCTATQSDGKVMLDVNIPGIESDGNSSTTILTSGSTFTGTGEQNGFPQVGCMVKTDQPGTLYFDFSADGTNWDSTFPVNGFKVAANIPDFHTAVKLGRYFRVRLVNDNDGDQTFLRLYTYYGFNFIPSVAPLNQALSIDHDATVSRHTIPEDEIVIGRRTGVSSFTKFAYRDGLTAANGEETVWATTGNFTPMTSAETFDISYTQATDGADAGATGALTLYIVYVDANGERAAAVHTLGSDGSDTTSFTGLGINRVAVSSSGSNQTNVNAITFTSTTSATKQAVIPAGEGVTQQALYHVASNANAVAKFLWINANKISGGASPRILVKAYVFNRTVATKFEVFRALIDTSSDSLFSILEPVGFALSPSDVLYFVADTDTNSTDIIIRFSLVEYVRA